MSPKSAPNQKPTGLDKSRCRFTTTDNRRCRMLRTPGHRTLCALHAQQDLQFRGAETAARQLLDPRDDFRTVATINRALGRLYTLLAHNRIPVRNAATLAYISQLLLQTLDPLRIEMRRALDGEEYCQFNISVKRVQEEANGQLMEKLAALELDGDSEGEEEEKISQDEEIGQEGQSEENVSGTS